MTETDVSAASRREPAGWPAQAVAYTGTIIAVGGALVVAAAMHLASSPPGLALVVALGVAIAVIYATPFHTDARPDSEGIHADDVFVVAALALLPVDGVISVMSIGALGSPVTRRLFGNRAKLRSQAPLKAAFNVALVPIYGAVAGGFVHLVGVGRDDLVLRAAVAILGAVLGNVVTRLAVAYAIELTADRRAAEVFVEHAGTAFLGISASASLGLLLTLVLDAYDGDVVLVAATAFTVVAGSLLLNRRIGDQATVADLLHAAEEIHASIATADVDAAAVRAARRLLRTADVHLAEHPVEVDDGACVPVPTHESPPRWLVVQRVRGSDRRIHADELPALEALATIIANARDNAELVQRLGRSDRTRGALLASISHDLRSPLAASLGTARTLLQHRLDEATSRHLLEGQERSLTRIDGILTDLIELERAELRTDRAATCDLATVVTTTLDGLELPGDPELRIDVPSLRVEMEPRALGRVLENLLTNAAKHTPWGGPVWVRAWREAGSVVLAVEDAGPGVDPGLRDSILQPFDRGDEEDRPSGLGLGLFVVSRFLSLYGAALDVEDREGGGASFQVRLWAASTEGRWPGR